MIRPRQLLLILLPLLCLCTSALAQELGVRVIVQPKNYQTQTLFFGVRSGALYGLDDFDLLAPPPEPETTFDAYLLMPSPPPGLSNRWWVDYRTLQELYRDREEDWDMALVNQTPGTITELHLDLPFGTLIPHQIFLRLPGEEEFVEFSPPVTIEFTVTDPNVTLTWKLLHADEIPNEGQAWGLIKSLYR